MKIGIVVSALPIRLPAAGTRKPSAVHWAVVSGQVPEEYAADNQVLRDLAEEMETRPRTWVPHA